MVLFLEESPDHIRGNIHVHMRDREDGVGENMGRFCESLRILIDNAIFIVSLQSGVGMRLVPYRNKYFLLCQDKY